MADIWEITGTNQDLFINKCRFNHCSIIYRKFINKNYCFLINDHKIICIVDVCFLWGTPYSWSPQTFKPKIKSHGKKKRVHLKFYENVKIYKKIHFFLYKNEALLMNYITYNWNNSLHRDTLCIRFVNIVFITAHPSRSPRTF